MFGKIIVSCFVVMVGIILLPVFNMAIKEVVDDWLPKDKIWKFPESKITKDETWKMKVQYDIQELNDKLKKLEEKIDAIDMAVNKRIDLVEENYKIQEFHTRYKIR